MTETDCNGVLRDMQLWERRAGLFDARWLGVSPWRLTRKRLILAHLAARNVREKSNFNERDAGQALRMIGNSLRSLLQLRHLRRCPFLFVGFPRRRLDDGAWTDPFVDPLIKLVGEDRTLCVERPFAGRHYVPAATRRLLYLDLALLLASAIGQSMSWLVAPFCRARLGPLTATVSAKLEVREGWLRRMMVASVIEFRVEAKLMDILLHITRPSCVLLTSRWVHASLIHASKRRGIRVFELQHGAVTHEGYAYSTPFDAKLDPDVMLTFGSYWNAFDWGVPRERVIANGYHYIRLRRDRLPRKGYRGRKVMFVSKPGQHRRLSEEFLRIAMRHPGREFLLRLHPQDVFQWETRYPVGRLPNVAVSSESEADLYETFSECAVVIGDESTVLYEAAFFGLTVAILNQDGRNACPAIAFSGRYNFVEIRADADLDDLLERPNLPSETGDSPFFAEFDANRFLALVS